MDIDPLSDTVPPRYAIESDEEEDEINPLRPTTSQEDTKVEVKITGELPSGNTLAIASGDTGTFWAKGAGLGEQTGAVFVNRVQIGLVFNPTWTKSTVIISEALSRLPLYAMYPYAKSILESLKPQSVSILDSYPVPTYATDKPIAFQDAPIRYLSTSEKVTKDAAPFSPPNLIQATSASFLSILSVSQAEEGTLILLPSPHIPHPPPRQIFPSNFSHLAQDNVEWSTQEMNLAQKLLFQTLGENAGIDHPWKPLETTQKERPPKRTTEIGEGGMYI